MGGAGLALEPSPQRVLSPHRVAVEWPPLSPELAFETAQLLLRGQGGHRELVDRLESESGERRRAAAVSLARSGEKRFLPHLLPLLESPIRSLKIIPGYLIQAHPETARPLLVAQAKSGGAGATRFLSSMGSSNTEILRELMRHRSKEVRLAAVSGIRPLDSLWPALEDASEEVLREAIYRLLYSLGSTDEMQDAIYFHRRNVVRAIAAEVTQRGSNVELSRWIKLSRDPNARVRKWAVLNLYSIAQPWRDGTWTSEAIDAVQWCIETGPEAVRKNAILAARGWALQWEATQYKWTPHQVKAAEKVFSSKVFRNQVYGLVKSQPSNITDWESVLDITVAGPLRSLALSNDPGAFDLLRSRLEGHSGAEPIRAFGLLRDDRVASELVRVVKRQALPSRGKVDWGDYSWREKALEIGRVLRARGDLDSQRQFVEVPHDKSAKVVARRALAQAIGQLSSQIALDALQSILFEIDEDREMRISATLGLQGIGTKQALAILESFISIPAYADLREYAERSAKAIRAGLAGGEG